MRRLFLTLRNVVLAGAFMLFAALITVRLDDNATERLSGTFRASDGDTLSFSGARYRLQGLDAPERYQTCGGKGAEWRCGEAARTALAAMVAEGPLECAGQERDRYGRLLVTCRAGGLNVNAEMVRQGMAIAYGGGAVDYRREEAEARAALRGLWSGPFDRPQDWRRRRGDAGEGGFARLFGLKMKQDEEE